MENIKKIELTLCVMLPYNLQFTLDTSECESTFGGFPTVVLKGLFHTPEGRVVRYATKRSGESGIGNCELRYVKPQLHSLNRLIDNILEDDNDYFYRLNMDLAEILSATGCDYFIKALIEKTYYAANINVMMEAIEWLKKNHFNIYDLPVDMYIEKSTVTS